MGYYVQMKIWAVSDIHIDYLENRQWLLGLSNQDYQRDILILAGDISHRLEHIELAFKTLSACFKLVCFTVGNHDLWCVDKQSTANDSLHKQQQITKLAEYYGIAISAVSITTAKGELRIFPLQSWYDYSFSPLNAYLLTRWADFTACSWPSSVKPIKCSADAFLKQTELDQNLCKYFLAANTSMLKHHARPFESSIDQADIVSTTLTFSHFMPRIDIMPEFIPAVHQQVYPVLGCNQLDNQLRQLASDIHVYGHSHVNRDETIEGVRYINNAFAAPSESRIARKSLYCVWLDEE